jgi:hypothetical protein
LLTVLPLLQRLLLVLQAPQKQGKESAWSLWMRSDQVISPPAPQQRCLQQLSKGNGAAKQNNKQQQTNNSGVNGGGHLHTQASGNT